MNDSSEDPNIAGIRYYRSPADPHTFLYQPDAPSAQRDPRGRPAISLFASDQGALLQLGAQWAAEDQVLVRLKRHLVARFTVDPALIRLSPVPASIDRVILSIGDGAGQFEELATSSSSGYPPYSAIFNVRLSTEQKGRAIAALNGRKDFLKIIYRGRLSGADGQPAPLEQSTDVGDWFAGGSGLDHMQVLGATLFDAPAASAPDPADGHSHSAPKPNLAPQPSVPPSTVSLGFDAKEAPIAFIRVTCGGAQGVLRGSAFDPVTLDGNLAGPSLVVATSYTASGPPFETTLPVTAAEGWVLGPPDLGLARIVADASSRRAAGSREVRLHVRYRPSGKGADDERTIYLRDDIWLASWFVITRSRDLGGILEFEWKDTATDGSAVFHRSATTDRDELTL